MKEDDASPFGGIFNQSTIINQSVVVQDEFLFHLGK